MRRVAKSAKDLVPGQFIRLLNHFDALSGPDSPHDCRDVHSCPSDAGLAESDIWVHRDPRKHLHDDLLRSHGPEHLHFSNDGATIIVARLGMWNRLGTLGDGGRPLTSSAAEAAKVARQDEVSASPLRVIG